MFLNIAVRPVTPYPWREGTQLPVILAIVGTTAHNGARAGSCRGRKTGTELPVR
ncbi:hypothetical protein SXCC_03513 [Gluconacetobacter sp. SXCC-1]|nr:hypothetical protein SXCC_03513 [Gluconacetobacter sp. SXCC-1]